MPVPRFASNGGPSKPRGRGQHHNRRKHDLRDAQLSRDAGPPARSASSASTPSRSSCSTSTASSRPVSGPPRSASSNHNLIYLLAWESMGERETKWAAFSTDPEWIEKRGKTEEERPAGADVLEPVPEADEVFEREVELLKLRHARPCAGHPRLSCLLETAKQGVDGRNKSGHDVDRFTRKSRSTSFRAVSTISFTRCTTSTRRDALSQLGFTVGARNRHPWGTHNRIVQFPGVFIELLTRRRDRSDPAARGRASVSFGAFTRDFLAQRRGALDAGAGRQGRGGRRRRVSRRRHRRLRRVRFRARGQAPGRHDREGRVLARLRGRRAGARHRLLHLPAALSGEFLEPGVPDPSRTA